MLDLKAEFNVFADEIREAVDGVLTSQQFVGGPAVAALEKTMCERVGVADAVAVSSGTDALLCTMMALGIGAGDEVIVPTFTFFATAGSVWRLGARPVFVDIDPKTFNVDPRSIEAAITPKTKAIVAVHLFGQCAEMDAINSIAVEHGLKVIEDAAQAIGAKYHGRSACALGDVACLSFYPTKNLGGFGEGGMIMSNDRTFIDVARQLRNHGQSGTYIHERVGGNFRLDTMKAAILLVKQRHLDEFTERRRAHAAIYDAQLANSCVDTPQVGEHQEMVYHQYSILTDRRDALCDRLRERGVGCGVYYPLPLHLQPCFASLGYKKGSLPVAEDTCERIMSLPCHPMMNDSDVKFVVDCIDEFHGASTCSHEPRADTARSH